MAERDDEAVATEVDDAAVEVVASTEPEPEAEPATGGDEQTEEAGTAVEA